MAKLSKSQFPGASKAQDIVVIAGGGPAAFAQADAILTLAEKHNQKIDVVVLADKLNWPVDAGTQVSLTMDGFYNGHGNSEIKRMMREGLDSFKDKIRHEDLSCRFSPGMEIKEATAEDLRETMDIMIQQGGYRPEDFEINTDNQQLFLSDTPHSFLIKPVGQINAPEYISALRQRIEQRGGKIIEGARYENHQVTPTGYKIQTTAGTFETRHGPILATGAGHLSTLPEFKKVETENVYTMGVVLGPLSDEDAQAFSKGPMTVVGGNVGGDFPWITLDPQNNLTFGCGDNLDGSPEKAKELEAHICSMINRISPGLTDRYPRKVSYGVMLTPANGMPTVGHLPNGAYVNGGWGGRGVVPSMVSGQVIAEDIVLGKDKGLKVFEAFHPDMFKQLGVHLQQDHDLSHDHS